MPKKLLEFEITDAAKHEIGRQADRFRKKATDRLIPAIMWIDSVLNQGTIPSGVAVGLYTEDQREELGETIIDDKGFEYILAIDDNDFIHFSNKTLDFQNDGFVLVSAIA
jgi:hypothetical protein